MLTGIHFLLTYRCDRACDHCFVFGSPEARGTFTLSQVRSVLDELPRIGTIEKVFFEGGEPFLFYPVMVEGIRLAREKGFETGIVTNGYWATSVEDGEFWLRPLKELELASLCISDDPLHYGDTEKTPAQNAVAAADDLGISHSLFVTESPRLETDEEGKTVVAGGVMFRGRAAEKLTEGFPTRPCQEFTECPAEDLRDPGRVHVDAYGNVHLCQGLLMGNLWETPLAELVRSYDPEAHPVVGPILRGGPARLADDYSVRHEAEYVSACHCCYHVRRQLLDKFPHYLAPKQLYGLE